MYLLEGIMMEYIAVGDDQMKLPRRCGVSMDVGAWNHRRINSIHNDRF
jgi:hypothetical protein